MSLKTSLPLENWPEETVATIRDGMWWRTKITARQLARSPSLENALTFLEWGRYVLKSQADYLSPTEYQRLCQSRLGELCPDWEEEVLLTATAVREYALGRRTRDPEVVRLSRQLARGEGRDLRKWWSRWITGTERGRWPEDLAYTLTGEHGIHLLLYGSYLYRDGHYVFHTPGQEQGAEEVIDEVLENAQGLYGGEDPRRTVSILSECGTASLNIPEWAVQDVVWPIRDRWQAQRLAKSARSVVDVDGN